MNKLESAWQHGAAWLYGLGILLVGLAIYAYAVNLPYRIDDFVHFRLLSAHTLADVWLGNAGLAYYRPLPFTLWKLIYWLTGSYSPHIIPAINVVCHAVNGVLVYALVRLHQPRKAAGTVTSIGAAILFLLFPFSYQAVPWAGSLTHPLVTLLILSGIVSAVYAQDHHLRWMRYFSLALAVLAPFAHETGVLLAPGLMLFHLTRENAGELRPAAPSGRFRRVLTGLRRALLASAPYWVISMLALVIHLLVRQHDQAAAIKLDPVSLLQNGVYFLQGLVYPAAPLASPLMKAFPALSDIDAVAIVSAPVVLVLCGVYLRLGQHRLLALAVGWYLLMIAPAWLALPFAYVVDGPRLMYEASPGAAILWAVPLAVIASRWQDCVRFTRAAGIAVAAVIVGGAAVGSIRFLSERADMYEQTRLASAGLIASATAPSSDTRNVLSVNFPAWIAPVTPTYALGHEGVSFIPAYSSPVDLVWAMTGVDRPMYNAVVTELQSRWRYNYLNYGSRWNSADLQPQLRIAHEVLFTSYRGHDLATYPAGKLERENTAPASQYVAAYSGTLALLGGQAQRIPEGLQVTLHWQSWVTLTEEVRTFVHLMDANNQMAAQEDGLPLMGLSNPLWWKPGDQWADTRILVLPPDLRAGKYVLMAGLYPAAGGPRLPAVNPAGVRIADDSAAFGSVTLP